MKILIFLCLVSGLLFSHAYAAIDQPKMSDDVDLATKITNVLKKNSHLSSGAQNVGVQQKSDKILLQGTVHSEKEKKKVEKIVKEASNGMEVINDIKVVK